MTVLSLLLLNLPPGLSKFHLYQSIVDVIVFPLTECRVLLFYSTRDGEPFTAFIDGPNVGYYMQNFDQGKFNMYQVDFMLNALENMGENSLVIMPQKYTLPSFNTSAGGKQRLDNNEMSIVEKYVSYLL